MKKFLLLFTFLFYSLSYANELVNVALSQNVNKVSELLKNGANPNLKNNKGETVLYIIYTHYIMENMNPFNTAYPKIIDLLLQYKADPKIGDSYGWTVLHRAIKQKKIYWVKKFLEKGADPNALYEYDRGFFLEGYRPLHLAIDITPTGNKKRLEMVELLLQHEADPNLTNPKGKTALAFAYETYKMEAMPAIGLGTTYQKIIDLLFKRGADPKIGDFNGWTVLHRAIMSKDFKYAKIFLEKGADINATLSDSKETALHLASEKGKIKSLKFLLENGADPNLKNKNGKTAFDLAGRESFIPGKGLIIKQILKKAMCKSAVTK